LNRTISVALWAMTALTLWHSPCRAYTAAGDRTFPASLVLPQIGPSEEIYLNGLTQPLTKAGPGSASRDTSGTTVIEQLITDRLGVQIEETYTRIDRVGASSLLGWQNTDTEVKYLAIQDGIHEFLMTVGVDREIGGTGAIRVGADPSGATTPRLYFGKGLGDLDLGYLRPLAVRGLVGYQKADQSPRPDLVQAGFAIEYSIPYLESKVEAAPLPDFLRSITPITELFVNTPGGGHSYGGRTSAVLAPGLIYSGQGYEAGLEAMVPLSRATGSGVGVIGQIHISLDYLFPESIGRPLLGGL